MKLSSFGRLPAALIALAFCVQPACSVVVDTSTEQCNADADCAALGPQFAGTYCGPQKVCLPTAGYCERNAECIERTGNDTTICRKSDHTCVGITTRECSTVFRERDDLLNDNAIIIGVHGIPSWAPIPLSGENGIELARRDIVATLRGLPASTTSNGQTRPLVLLACDVPIGDQAKHQVVTDHLIDTVGVPAIIGPYATPDFLAYALTKAPAKEVALLTVAQTYAGFTAPGSEGLRLSLAAPSNALTRVQAESVTLVENKIRAGGKTGDLKLAFVSPGFGISTGDAPDFVAAARLNGKPVAENGANYKEFIYGDPASPALAQGLANAVVAIRAFAPDILVLTGANEGAEIPVRLEETAPGIHYILRTESAQNRVATAFSGNEERRKRVFAAALGLPNNYPPLQRLFERYAQSFDGQVGNLAAIHYDALYYLAWAIGAIKDRPVTGRAIGELLIRSLKQDGEKIATDSNGLSKAISNLEQGRPIFAQGAAGPLAFDPTGQISTWAISLFCLNPDATSQTQLTDSGLYYDGLTSAFVGSNTCF